MAHRILIVDDSAVIRQSLRSSIEQHSDWQVCGEAENGVSAVERVKQLAPDLVILDLQMPFMNGLEAAREIVRIAPNTAMLMFTMYNSKYLTREARFAGIKGVFSKCDANQGGLFAAIQTILGPGNPAQSA
jgi:DNA-binding NarL/FixJ family response regulator